MSASDREIINAIIVYSTALNNLRRVEKKLIRLLEDKLKEKKDK